MSKKELYYGIKEIFENGHIKLAKVNSEINPVEQAMQKKYITAPEVRELKNRRHELITQEKKIKEDMRNAIVEKAEATKAEITRAADSAKLDGASVNADITLLNSGVHLNNDDVITIMRRNAGNMTMLNLCMKYMEQENNLDYTQYSTIMKEFPELDKYQQDINIIDHARIMCNMLLNGYPPVEYIPQTEQEKAAGKAPVPQAPELYNKYIAEGGQIYNELCNDNYNPCDDAEM